MRIDDDTCEKLLISAALHGVEFRNYRDFNRLTAIANGYENAQRYPEKLKFIESLFRQQFPIPAFSVTPTKQLGGSFRAPVAVLSDVEAYLKKKSLNDKLSQLNEIPCISKLINKYNFKFVNKPEQSENILFYKFDYVTADRKTMTVDARLVQLRNGRDRFWHELSYFMGGKICREKMDKIESDVMSMICQMRPVGFPSIKEVNLLIKDAHSWICYNDLIRHMQCYIDALLLIEKFNQASS